MAEPSTLPMFRMSPEATLFSRQSDGAAGYDIYSSVDMEIQPGLRDVVKTSIALAVPDGYYGRIAPRSGLAVKKGIRVEAGVIDSDYRGEIVVCLSNAGNGVFVINKGDRIAQFILEKITTPSVVEVKSIDELGNTGRGDGGFGSTGL